MWRHSRGLRREILLVLLVKTLLLAFLVNVLAVPGSPGRIGTDGVGRHLLGIVPMNSEESAHER